MPIKKLPKNFLKKAVAKAIPVLPKGYCIEPEPGSDDSWVIKKVHLKGTPDIIGRIGIKEEAAIFLSDESEIEVVGTIADKLKISDIDIDRCRTLMTEIVTIEVECTACGGTGIYHGFAEPAGVGVICLGCNGTGRAKLKYKPFTGRKVRKDIKTVQRSRGGFIATGIGPAGKSITYDEFLKGKMP